MPASAVTIEQRDRIAIVRFDRGDRVNALSLPIMRDLVAAARGFEDDHRTAAIVLTGDAKVFSMGLDLHDPGVAELADLSTAEQRQNLAIGARLCRTWAEAGPIVIAAIEGWCVGGGLALAVACDLRVAGDGATFYAPEIERGMNMSWGSLPRFVNLVGPARTKRLTICAEQLDAPTAERWGLIDRVAPNGAALDTAIAWAEHIAGMPLAMVRMNKEAIDAYANALAHTASHADRDQFAFTQRSPEHAEGRASFVEKRKPRFTDG